MIGPPPAAGRRLPRWLSWSAAGLVLLLIGWLIAFSSVLGVRSVDVRGARTLTSAQLRAAGGIRTGAPLARLDTAAVGRRLAALPQIRTVTVSTSYPSTVTITVTERVAVGYRSEAGSVGLVDADDVAFRTMATPPIGLPRLDVPGADDRSRAAAQVAGILPAALAGKLTSITAPTSESVTLHLNDGRTVLWGGTDRSADKARLLTVLIGQPGSYFDLSDPSEVLSRGSAASK